MHRKLTVAALLVAGHLSLPAVLIGLSRSRWTQRDVDAVVDLDERDPAAGAAVLAMLRAQGATVTGIPGADPARLAALYERTRAVFGNDAEDLRLVAYVRWPRGTDVKASIADLRRRPGVETVDPWRQPEPAGDLPPNTAPNLALPLVGFQGYAFAARNWPSGYRGSSPIPAPGGHGIGQVLPFASASGPNGAAGSTVRIGVIELGFDTSPASFPALQVAPSHEDLQAANITVVFESGASVTATQIQAEHGIATLGVLVGDKDQPSPTAGPGVTGIVPAAPIVLVQLQTTVATAIAAALGAIAGVNPTPLVAGDVLLIEAQLGSGAGALPVSTSSGDRAAIQNAVAQGIHVIEPAANGGLNVDVALAAPFGIFDSLAIMVGAISPTTGLPSVYASGGSNFGTRVNVCSWGSNCATLGPIGNPGGIVPNQPLPIIGGSLAPYEQYTNAFDGTSSASAVIAGVVALALDALNTSFQVPAGIGVSAQKPSPSTVRAALMDIAPTPLPANHIGAFPDALQLLRRLSPARYGTGGNIYFPAGLSPAMTNVQASALSSPSTPLLFSEARLGATFVANLMGVPLYANFLSGIAVSAAGANVPYYPGNLLIDPNQLLYSSPVLSPSTYMFGCASSPGLCGQLLTPLPIPVQPSLVGIQTFLQGITADYNPAVPVVSHISSALMVTISN